jgi:hypothetical protein
VRRGTTCTQVAGRRGQEFGGQLSANKAAPGSAADTEGSLTPLSSSGCA